MTHLRLVAANSQDQCEATTNLTANSSTNVRRAHPVRRAADVLPLVVFVAGAVLMKPFLPAWAAMWLLATAFYAGFKWLTWRRALPRRRATIPMTTALGYLLLWPGMNPRTFLARSPPASPSRGAALAGWPLIVGKILAGALLLFAVARMAFDVSPLLAGWIGMVGTSFLLHFGLFHALAVKWQSRGIAVEPLMRNPAAAESLGDFWSVRWNRAFPDLVQPLLVRPIARILGAGTAILVAFVFSGLVHDVVISFPAGAGYGGPTIYFIIQGVVLMAERAVLRRRPTLRGTILLRAFTFAVFLAPVGLLFHRPFVLNVYVPFMQAIGAL